MPSSRKKPAPNTTGTATLTGCWKNGRHWRQNQRLRAATIPAPRTVTQIGRCRDRKSAARQLMDWRLRIVLRR